MVEEDIVMNQDQASNNRILVVDDYGKNLELLNEILTMENYNPTLMTNGRDAIEQVKIEPPYPVIISDYMMPEMDGIQFFEEVKKLSPNSSRYLISGMGQTTDLATLAKRYSIDFYSPKPLNISEFLKNVEEGIQRFNNNIES